MKIKVTGPTGNSEDCFLLPCKTRCFPWHIGFGYQIFGSVRGSEKGTHNYIYGAADMSTNCDS